MWSLNPTQTGQPYASNGYPAARALATAATANPGTPGLPSRSVSCTYDISGLGCQALRRSRDQNDEDCVPISPASTALGIVQVWWLRSGVNEPHLHFAVPEADFRFLRSVACRRLRKKRRIIWRVALCDTRAASTEQAIDVLLYVMKSAERANHDVDQFLRSTTKIGVEVRPWSDKGQARH